jgi:hypothetical protein
MFAAWPPHHSPRRIWRRTWGAASRRTGTCCACHPRRRRCSASKGSRHPTPRCPSLQHDTQCSQVCRCRFQTAWNREQHCVPGIVSQLVEAYAHREHLAGSSWQNFYFSFFQSVSPANTLHPCVTQYRRPDICNGSSSALGARHTYANSVVFLFPRWFIAGRDTSGAVIAYSQLESTPLLHRPSCSNSQPCLTTMHSCPAA